MPFPLIPLLLGGGSFLSGLFGQKAKNKAAQQANTSTSNNTNTVTSTPTLDPAYKSLQDMILPSITKRLSNPGGLPAGYLENGIQNINETYRDVGMGLNNDLTARGLATSPIAGSVDMGLQRGRATDIAKFRNSSEMMGREMENEDLATALSILNFGKGQTTTSTGSGTVTGPAGTTGSPLAAGFGDLSTMLGWLIGSGAFNKGGGRAPLNSTMNPMNFLSMYK